MQPLHTQNHATSQQKNQETCPPKKNHANSPQKLTFLSTYETVVTVVTVVTAVTVMTVVTLVTVVTIVTVVTVATEATVVTEVTKQLCTPKNLNLPTYLPM